MPNDLDPILLLALAIAAKKRPAELVEIVAAIALVTDVVPAEIRLVDAFARLSAQGLLVARERGYVLTLDGEKIVSGGRRSAATEQRLQSIKDQLAAYIATSPTPVAPLHVAAKEMCAAIIAQRATRQSTVKNLLVPKPKPVDTSVTRPGQRQRKPLPARRPKH